VICTLVAKAQLSYTITELVFQRNDKAPATFQPGQYVIVHTTHEGRSEGRPYSLCRPPAPSTSRYHVCVQTHDGGFAETLGQTNVGTTLEVEGPKGSFVLPAQPEHDLLLIASGTGISPFFAMHGNLVDWVQARRVALLFGARRRNDLLFDDAWRALEKSAPEGHFRYLPILSRPQAEDSWSGPTGYAQSRLDELDTLEPATTRAYLCGHYKMVEQLRALLAARGFAKDAIIHH
jgi:ferredoxin-NADP reductase